jgi:membrane protein YqaA with SNARE-associated domain
MIIESHRAAALALSGLLLTFMADAGFLAIGPEIPFVGVVVAARSWWIPASAVAVSMIGEVIGTSVQYAVVRHGKGRGFELVRRTLVRYLDLVGAARLPTILWNRLVPVVPCMGAVISLRSWPLLPALGLVALGGLLKYGTLAIALRVGLAAAPRATVGLVAMSLAIAWIAFNVARELHRRHRQGRTGPP